MRTFQAWGVETSRGKIATEKVSWGTTYVITTGRPLPWRQGEKGEKVVRLKIQKVAMKRKRK